MQIGDFVQKIGGPSWLGRIVGAYSTGTTPAVYCAESIAHGVGLGRSSKATVIVVDIEAAKRASIANEARQDAMDLETLWQRSGEKCTPLKESLDEMGLA